MIAIASADRFVVGLDISDQAIKIATEVTADCFHRYSRTLLIQFENPLMRN